jgi:long-chain acyl-CoA synthetase
MLGDAYEDFMAQKLEVVESDLSGADLGLSRTELARLQAALHLVVHCAGNTDFTPPLRDSLHSNTMGARNMLAFARGCANAKLLHISTCYVAGERDGLVPEDESLSNPFPAAAPERIRDEEFDPALELEQALRRCAEVEAASRDQALSRRFL